jgi:NADH oxidase (H2O2-forming)
MERMVDQMKGCDVLIIGGGPGGRTSARTIKGIDPGKKVTVLKDEEVNANRCVLPYVFDGTVPLEKASIPNSLVMGWGVELVIDKVVFIDTKNKKVKTQKDEMVYQHLVLATGAVPIVPPIPGSDLGNVFTLRTLNDASAILEGLKKSKSIVVVGGGYIGVEMGATLQEAGFDVTLIELLGHCLQNVFHVEFCAEVEEKLESEGVRLITGSRVEALMGKRSVRAVRVGGVEVEADLVIFAVGVKPNIDLAKEGEIRTSPYGIQIDESMRTNVEDIYAAGDCIEKRSFITHQPVLGQLGTNAVIEGRIAGENILGKRRFYKGAVNASACLAFDLPFGFAGLTETQARDHGLKVIIGRAQGMSRYPQMPQAKKMRSELIFEESSGMLIGGQIIGGENIAGYVDLISLSIKNRLGIDELRDLNYCTHPGLADRPSENIIATAAEDAYRK